MVSESPTRDEGLRRHFKRYPRHEGKKKSSIEPEQGNASEASLHTLSASNP
jgi:hypothetical protein